MTGPKSKDKSVNELEKMAKNLAHEINSPLSTIQLHAENIVEEIEEGISTEEDLKDSAHIIIKSVERINKIIKAVRSYSRMNFTTPFLSANLSELIEDSISEITPKLKAANVDIEFASPEESAIVKCRSTEISQILVNLIKNATEAIEKQDKPWIKISIAVNNDLTEVRIVDSGKGISQDLQNKIFQPLFSTKSRKSNLGVGLALCRKIAEIHGGTLELDDSSENTCFVLSLPQNPPALFTTDEAA